DSTRPDSTRTDSTRTGSALPVAFRSRADSLSWVRARDAAHRAQGKRLVVSVRERKFWWMDGARVLRTAPVAVGKGTRLAYGDKVWEFKTPRGVRRVLDKERNPVWIPPEWHYVELARDSAFKLVHLQRGAGVRLADGGRVVVRGERIVHLRKDGSEEVIPTDEEILFGDTLFVPPLGTANRRIAGELGAYKLEIGDGYMLHGTPHQDSIGQAATHGCIRLADADIEYLYRNVPVGTPVHIY
ncbi:MAG: L,D-transpeptidase, partial [Gemmatimonadota bacterium]|nr:L,D-transpeptidase [Gemmatimonadota bacterium]